VAAIGGGGQAATALADNVWPYGSSIDKYDQCCGVEYINVINLIKYAISNHQSGNKT